MVLNNTMLECLNLCNIVYGDVLHCSNCLYVNFVLLCSISQILVIINLRSLRCLIECIMSKANFQYQMH